MTELTDQEMCDWANANIERVAELEAENKRLKRVFDAASEVSSAWQAFGLGNTSEDHKLMDDLCVAVDSISDTPELSPCFDHDDPNCDVCGIKTNDPECPELFPGTKEALDSLVDVSGDNNEQTS